MITFFRSLGSVPQQAKFTNKPQFYLLLKKQQQWHKATFQQFNFSHKKEVIAMPRKIVPLKKIYPKDIRCMSVLARSGAMTPETFNKMEISNNRIKSYVSAGIIKKTFVPSRSGTGGKNYYVLTDKRGKEFVKNECNIKHLISNADATVHNAKVAETVSCLSRAEQESCLSERELKGFIEDKLEEYHNNPNHWDDYIALKEAIENRNMSLPDIIYKKYDSAGAYTYEALEITTNNYSKQDLEMKTTTLKLLGIEKGHITFVHT